jgi:hypothetical protein
MRTTAETMQNEDCRAKALRLAENYERLARHADALARMDC